MSNAAAMARIDLVALQQRMAQQQPKPVPTEPPSGTLRATPTMRAALPLKATNARAERAEERAMVKALRAQIDELKDEMAAASAEAERALVGERQRADRLNKQVETLSAEVVQAKKQAEAVVGRAERAEADRDAERTRADELRTTIDELKAAQALVADVHARGACRGPARCSGRAAGRRGATQADAERRRGGAAARLGTAGGGSDGPATPHRPGRVRHARRLGHGALPARAGTADAPSRRAVGPGHQALADRAAADRAGDPGAAAPPICCSGEPGSIWTGGGRNPPEGLRVNTLPATPQAGGTVREVQGPPGRVPGASRSVRKSRLADGTDDEPLG